MSEVKTLGKLAKEASSVLAVSGSARNLALQKIAEALIQNDEFIIAENKKDLALAKENGISDSMVDRLMLNKERIASMADAVIEIAKSSDPLGKVLEGKTLENGLLISKVTVPLGVIGIIFESRPNVSCDCAALCIKSGNTVILRGGKEAINSNTAIVDTMREAIEVAGLPKDCINLIKDTSRQSAKELMELSEYLDLLIPRGGAGLIRAVVENAKVPVIETGAGNCHVYVDKSADFTVANNIIFNAKTSRPSVCNAIETVLVHKDIAKEFLPQMKQKLDEKDVELRVCEKTSTILPESKKAEEEDWFKEYGDYILAVKIVDDVKDAVEHIEKYSTKHSECIVTSDIKTAEFFINSVDSAAVYINASTRFTDGGEFGLGAEIGISTQKLHARGPMGVEHLTSYKYVIRGNGQIR